MLKQLGRIIEKRPWLVVTFIVLITIGFATILPSLRMETNFNDFMPDDEVTKANMRVVDYFGQTNLLLLLYCQAEKADSTLTVDALREQYYIEKQLLKIQDIEESASIITFIDQICQLEFGTTFENSTDEQIIIALDDLLDRNPIREIDILPQDDPNEEIDYKRFPRLSKGKSIDDIDIKNCKISYDEDSITFNIEVYDLSSLEKDLKSPIPSVNVMEWFIDFENLIKPVEELDVSYKLAVHIEPKFPLWEVGKGFIENIKQIFNHIRNRELFNNYKKETYLWVKVPGEEIFLPLLLNTSKIDFITSSNLIKVDVSKEELARYGIAPKFGAIELPAKIANFKAGTRYYQTANLRLPWFRVITNFSYLIDTLENIKDRPILGKIAQNFLINNINLTWEEFDLIFENFEEYIPIPDQIALKDIETSWIYSDIAPDEGRSEKQLFIRSSIFDEYETTIKSFLSNDYEIDGKPSASLIILNQNSSLSQNEIVVKTESIIKTIETLDSREDYISVMITGDGVISFQLNEVTNEANTIIAPMIFVVIIGILFISFRRASYVFLPLIALVIAMVWLFGTMVLLDKPFTTISVALIPLIMGLGVDYSVHLSHNYRSELAKGKSPAQSIKQAIVETGTAMFLAMITTIIAFLSFLSAALPPIRDLGLLLACGITYTFITAITLQAAVRYIIDRKKDKLKISKKKTFRLSNYMGIFSKKILNHQKLIIISMIAITFVAGFGATQLETSFNFNSFVPEDNPSIKLYEKISDNFQYASQEQEYILLEGEVASVATINGIIKTYENIDDDTFVSRKADGTIKVNSIYDIFKQAVNNNASLIERFNIDPERIVPRQDQDVKKFYDYLYDSFEYGIQTKNVLYRAKSGIYEATLIRVFIDIISEGRESSGLQSDLENLKIELREDVVDYGNVDAIVTGQFIIWDEITASLSSSQILSTGISLVLATIVLMIAYRRFTLGLIAMLPVIISIIWILGTMFFIGYTLNILTITVTSLTIGIGIDYAIHATERFKLIADKTGNIRLAVIETISRTGGALLIAALTTALGFAVLIFAPIPPQVQFGVITSLTITFAFISSVLLLPLILAKWAKWSKKHKGYIISKKPADEIYVKETNSNDNY